MWIVLAFLLGLGSGVVGGSLLLLYLVVPTLERFFVFRPARDILKTPKDLGLSFDQCFIETSDGCLLSAWHLCPEPPVGGVVYFHGNTGNLGFLNEILGLLYKHGLQVLAVDYRGYGWSTGVPSEQGVYSDAVAAVKYFQSRFQRRRLPLIYWGRSLGSCVASYAAQKDPPDGLILESPFFNKASLLQYFPRLRPFRFFARYRLDTHSHLNGVFSPVLIIHGDRDKTIPIEQGRRLYETLKGPKQFYRVAGGGHVDLHMIDTDRYMKTIVEFVTRMPPTVQ